MDVEIKFEPDGRSGIVATGSYLFDAAKRLGIHIEAECERQGACDSCKVTVVNGKNLLSEPTKAELEILDAEQIIKGERLSCQTKIIAAGEITVMAEKKEPEKTEEEKAKEAEQKHVEDFRKEFNEMPLEKKIAALVDLEAAALSETLSYVINSPYKLVDAMVGVLAEFGLKMDREEKERKRPTEHKEEEKSEEKDSTDGKKKKSAKKAKEEKSSGEKKAGEKADKSETDQ